ncbi:MAG: response regulator transcription factor [Anaerolineae bacterium]|jgi:DNA-binding NarL/FixJ family response regulator|nr:response regulator transcription factor [Anaerolineae bacterium]
MTIRMILADDQDVVRLGLAAILSTEPALQVLDSAADGAEAVYMAEKYQPDLVLMDLKMPVMNGIQATRIIRERFPAVKVLVLTTYDADEWVFDAIRAGASGYLLKDSTREDLVKAIRLTVEGQTAVDPHIGGKLFAHVMQNVGSADSRFAEHLSEREVEILKLLARGLNNHAIAEHLHLSEGTVRNYVSSILSKLDVSDRTHAAILALRHGLVELE